MKDVRSQKSEVRSQKSEVRSQKSEVRSPLKPYKLEKLMKAICSEPIVIPDENNEMIKYEAGQEFEMDDDIFEALKEAGLKIQKAG